MITEYILNYKLVSKFGLDRGEIGGYETVQSFDTEEEAREFTKKYKTAKEYKGLGYYEQLEYPDDAKFFQFIRPLKKRIEIYDKADYFPKASLYLHPIDNKYPDFYEFHGRYKEGIMMWTEGYFCHTSEKLSDVWDVMKSRRVAEGKIWAIFNL